MYAIGNKQKEFNMTDSVHIEEDVILIRIPKFYHENISDEELYEITRGVWKMGKRREKARFAFSIFGGEIKAVYEINSWHKAFTTEYKERTDLEMLSDEFLYDRYEFLGKISHEMQNKYIGKSVKKYFPKGAANPFRYVNC